MSGEPFSFTQPELALSEWVASCKCIFKLTDYNVSKCCYKNSPLHFLEESGVFSMVQAFPVTQQVCVGSVLIVLRLLQESVAKLDTLVPTSTYVMPVLGRQRQAGNMPARALSELRQELLGQALACSEGRILLK